MMKGLFTFALILVSTGSLIFAQQGLLLPVRVDGKWGYINDAGEMAIQPQYDFAGPFDENGFADVVINGKTNLIDRNAEVKFTSTASALQYLGNELVKVQDNGLWGIFTTNGEEIIPPAFLDIKPFYDKGFLIVSNTGTGLLSLSGEEVLPPVYTAVQLVGEKFLKVYDGSYQGIASLSGGFILQPVYETVELNEFRLFHIKQEGLEGLADTSGTELLKPEHLKVECLDKNFAKVLQHDGWQLYSIPARRITVEQRFDEFIPFAENYLLAYRNGKAGMIRSGELLLPPEYDEIRASGHERLVIMLKDEKWGIASENGKVLITPQYDIIHPFDENVALVQNGALLGLINQFGTELASPEYHRIVAADGSAKLYRDDGQFIILQFAESGVLTDSDVYANGRTITIRRGFTGGSLALPPTGFAPTPPAFTNQRVVNYKGWFFDSDRNRWGKRDTSGNIRIPPIFTGIREHPDLTMTEVEFNVRTIRYKDNKRIVREESKWGVVDDERVFLICMPLYKVVFTEDLALNHYARAITYEDRFHLFHKNGTRVPADFVFADSFSYNYARINVGGKLSFTENDQVALFNYNQLNRTMEWSGRSFAMEINGSGPYPTVAGGRWGYVDTAGKIHILRDYQFVTNFKHGVALVQKSGRWGAIDTSFKEVIPTIYSRIDFVKGGTNAGDVFLRLQVPERNKVVADLERNFISDPVYNDVQLLNEEYQGVKIRTRWYLADWQGTFLDSVPYFGITKFSNGLAAFREGRYWSYMTEAGAAAFSGEFSVAGNFSEGLAPVREKRRYGYINTKGEMVIRSKFKRAGDFKEGLAIVERGRKGVVDQKGRWIIPPKYHEIQIYYPEKRIIASSRSGSVLFDFQGKKISKARKMGEIAEALLPFRGKNGYGYMNLNGEVVVPEIFTQAKTFSEGFAAVRTGNKWGYINTHGKIVLEPQYGWAGSFKCGMAIIMIDYQQFYIDRFGSLYEFSRHELQDFSECKAFARENKGGRFINPSGQDVFNTKFEDAMPFQNGFAAVKIDGFWGVINEQGALIVPNVYTKVLAFDGKTAKLQVQHLYAIANLQGEIVVPPLYDSIELVNDELLKVQSGTRVGYLGLNGYWLWQPRH